MGYDNAIRPSVSLSYSLGGCARVELPSAAILTRDTLFQEITGLKFTKFVHDVDELSPCNQLKTVSRSSNPLPNAIANSEGGGSQYLRITPKIN